jgi:hypothetical protein
MSASTLIGLENKFRVLFQYFHSNFAENSSVFAMKLNKFEHLSTADANFYS